MATFCLVHGSWHGGWCWEPLAHELEELGHEVVAPDLPCDDPSADLRRYVEDVGSQSYATVVGLATLP